MFNTLNFCATLYIPFWSVSLLPYIAIRACVIFTRSWTTCWQNEKTDITGRMAHGARFKNGTHRPANSRRAIDQHGLHLSGPFHSAHSDESALCRWQRRLETCFPFSWSQPVFSRLHSTCKYIFIGSKRLSWIKITLRGKERPSRVRL